MDEVEKQLDTILTDLFGNAHLDAEISSNESQWSIREPEVRQEDTGTIYDILNLVPESRKTLNILFRKSNLSKSTIEPVNKSEHRINKSLLQECFAVSDLMEQEEKRNKFSASSTNTTLQLESPITFAWSNKNGKDHVKEAMQIQQKKNTMKEIQTCIQLPSILSNCQNHKSVNETLLKIVKDNLVEVTKNTKSWSYILQGIEQQEMKDSQDLDNRSLNEDKIIDQKYGKRRSDFKVDPLEKFVVTTLPRMKKNSDPEKDSKTNKSRSKSLRWIWGGSDKQRHKKKNKKKDKEKRVQSVKDDGIIGTIKKPENSIDTMNHTIPSIEDGRNNLQDKMTESYDLQKVGVDFDLDDHSFTGSNELCSMNSTKQTSFNFSITINTQNKRDTHNFTINNIDLISDKIENIQSDETNIRDTGIFINSNDNVNDTKLQDCNSDDDDFGEFEMSDTETKMSNNDDILILNNKRDENSVGDSGETSIIRHTIPSVMSFISLQPHKKSAV